MIILNYKHIKGKNCESTAQKNVIDYLGIELREEIIFGLDGSFGFMFFENTMNNPDILVGKSDIFPGDAAKFLGIKVDTQTSLSGKMGWDAIKKYLKNNIPLIARVDIGYLPYWKMLEESYFGGYFVVICGYEEEGEEYAYLSDCNFNEIQKVTAGDLVKSRSSKMSPPINPNNLLYIFSKPRMTPKIEVVGPPALRKTIRSFLYPAIGTHGVQGLKKLKRIVAKWPETKKGEIKRVKVDGSEIVVDSLKFQLSQFSKFIDEFGTGGGCFRFMFSDFLQELFNITNEKMFKESTDLMHQSAEKWRGIALLINKSIDKYNEGAIGDVIQEISTQIGNIYDLEKEAFKIIEGV